MLGEIVGKWLHHSVKAGTKGFVRKIPTNMNPYKWYHGYNIAKDSSNFFLKNLPDFTPSTRVIPKAGDTGYYLIQKEITNGITLSEYSKIFPHGVWNKLIEFLDRCEDIVNSEWICVDFFGYPWEKFKDEVDEFVANSERFNRRVDALSSRFLQKIWRKINRVRWYIWRIQYQSDIMKSSNIMIDGAEEKIYFVDTVQDIYSPKGRMDDLLDRKFQIFLIRKCKSQIHRILQNKSTRDNTSSYIQYTAQ